MSEAIKHTGYDLKTRLWIGFVIALPLSAVIAGISTLVIAVSNSDSVVFEKVVKDGKTVTMESQGTAIAAGVYAGFSLQLAADGTATVSVSPEGLQQDQDFELFLVHPTIKEHDRKVSLAAAGNNRFSGHLQLAGLPATSWHVILKTDQATLRTRATFPLQDTSEYNATLLPLEYADY